MFRIEESEFGMFSKVKLINCASDETISIIPEYGGNVAEIVLNNKGNNYSILDGASDDSDFIKYMKNTYRGAKLIPFPNRIQNGKYSFEETEYQFPINEMDKNHRIHGFLYDKKLDIIEKTLQEEQASLRLGYNYKGDVEGYPFLFNLQVTYSLSKEDGFKCTTEINNVDNREIPIGDGWHPYFTTGCKIDDLFLELPTGNMIELDTNMIPTGEMVSFDSFSTPSKIGNMKFDTTIYLGNRVEKVSTYIYDTEADVKINIWQDTGKKSYKYLQIYIPPHRRSIAVEPITCNVNAFNNNDGLIILKPGESFKASYGVVLQ